MKIARLPILFMVVLVTFTRSSALSCLTIDDPKKDVWIGMYLNGKKMGWTSVSTAPATLRGQNFTKTTTHSFTKMLMFGQTISQDTETVTYSDANHRPMFQEHRIRSKGSIMELQAEYKPDKILITFHAGGSASSREVAIPPGARLVADSTFSGESSSHQLGKTESFYYLNPLTIDLEKTDVMMESADSVKVRGTQQKLFRMRSTSSMGIMRSWETTAGDLVKAEMSLGPTSIAMFTEAKESAMNPDGMAPKFEVAGETAGATYVPPVDFALSTAVSVNRPIEKPRELAFLKARISGVPDPSRAISEVHQKALPLGETPGTYEYSVTAINPSGLKPVMLPIADDALKLYLAPAPYLEGTDVDLVAQTKKLVGSDKNAASVVQKLRTWVFQNMTPDYTIGVPRSSGEIFHKRRGVCRDYAALFAGMARVAGVPTRLVGGIVFGDGKFYYHAWAECWLGEWVPVDPTLNMEVVDATHVKFAQGDVTDMYRVANIVGKLKIEIIESR